MRCPTTFGCDPFYGSTQYVLDPRYTNERVSLIHSYYLIEKDFKSIFDFVDFDDRNKKCFLA